MRAMRLAAPTTSRTPSAVRCVKIRADYDMMLTGRRQHAVAYCYAAMSAQHVRGDCIVLTIYTA
jgi:hypothetical protein